MLLEEACCILIFEIMEVYWPFCDDIKLEIACSNSQLFQSDVFCSVAWWNYCTIVDKICYCMWNFAPAFSVVLNTIPVVKYFGALPRTFISWKNSNNYAPYNHLKKFRLGIWALSACLVTELVLWLRAYLGFSFLRKKCLFYLKVLLLNI